MIEHFVSGSTTRTAAALIGVNKSTTAYFLDRLREVIVLNANKKDTRSLLVKLKSMKAAPEEVLRGEGALGRTLMTDVKGITDALSATLYLIIARKVVPGSIVYSDCSRGANMLDVSEFKPFQINHSAFFQTRKITLTVSRTFRLKHSAICGNLTVFQRPILADP
ncbi:MAG: hypothetical protein JKY17_00345 [Magnetovibrio sp.]|nr:hypothetical protein [Magnetovibrio sp.]